MLPNNTALAAIFIDKEGFMLSGLHDDIQPILPALPGVAVTSGNGQV
jgi:hypothetical protein